MFNSLSSSACFRTLIVLLAGLAGSGNLLAQNAWNKTGTSSWNVAGNWAEGVPGAGSFALIDTGGTSVIGAGVSAATRTLLVGRENGGAVLIDGGSLTSIYAILGQRFTSGSAAGIGSVGVQNGGVWDATGPSGNAGFPAGIKIGGFGAAGFLYVLPGGTVNANEIKVGDTSGGTGTLSMFGTLNVTSATNSTLWVGWENPGIYNQYSGTATLRQITVGAGPTTGTATMLGGTMDSQVMIIGDKGTGTFLQLGGLVRASAYATFGLQGGTGTLHLAGGVYEASVFEELGGSGKIRLNGGTLRALRNESNFMQGFESGDVTLEAELGGSFIDTNGYSIGINTPISGGGRLTKVGNGLLTLSGFNTYSGGTTVRSGTLAVSGSGTYILHDSASVLVGDASGDNAVFEINDNTGVLSTASIIGNQAFSVGRVVVNGGAWTDFSTITVGNAGFGTLQLVDGFAGASGGIILGASSGGSGYAIVTEGILQTYGNFTVGNAGAGTLLINGGLVAGMDSDAAFRIGETASGSGSVTVNGGTMSTLSAIHVGVAGRGNLLLNGGSISSASAAMGVSTGGSGTATVTSGTWTISDSLAVGAQGTGALNVNGGLVSVSGTTTLAAALTSGSIFLTNTSGTAGVLATRRVVEGTGSGSVNFNGGILRALADESAFISGFEDGDLTTTGAGATIDTGAFSIGIGSGFSGTGRLTKIGAGTLSMAGLSTYSGSTTVQAGKFVFNGTNSGNSTVTIQSGAELAGAGRFSGTVTVANDATLSPGNSAGTLSMGSLILNDTTDLRFELGTVSDLVVVTSGLTLDGLLTVTNLSGFGEGSYTLFQYGGTLTNNGLSLVSMPAGYYYSLDFSQIGFVRLLVDDAQYWDGSNTTPNGVVNGGSGTWNNSTTNWTSVNGSVNQGWTGSGVAVFTGSSGVVTVAETINVANMDFLTDGYMLTGTGVLAISGTTLGVNAGSGVTAGIGTSITGTGGLLKTGLGTLALTGSNSYSGGTTVKSGTLAVSGAGASINHGSAATTIGDASGDTGALQIVGGGLVSNTIGYLGNAAGASGSATVTAGTWANSGNLYVGNSGTGSLLVNGGLVSNTNGYIGFNPTGIGSASVTSGTWANSGNLSVGYQGRGSLAISGGLVSNVDGEIGRQVGSTGSVTVSGGTWNNAANLYVGSITTGTLAVSGGLVRNVIGYIANNPGSAGVANVSSGTWLNTGSYLYVGSQGTGTLNLTGGLVSSGTTRVSNAAGSVGALNLSGGILQTLRVVKGLGTGSVVFNSGTLQARGNEADFLSSFSAGDVVINSGGAFVDSGTYAIGVTNVLSGTGALTKLGSGTMTLTAANTYTGGTTISAGLLQIGNGGTTGSVAGNILNNGNLFFNRSNALTYAGVISGTGHLTQRGTGLLTITGSSSYTGNTTVRSGTLVLDGGTLNHPGQYVSIGHPDGTGTLNIINGGRIFSSAGNIGNAATTVGNAAVTNGSWTLSGGMTVGVWGEGNLLINGGVVNSAVGTIGFDNLASGIATVSSGTWAMSNASGLFVGASGTGTLTLTDTGLVRVGGGTGTATLGRDLGSFGTMNIGTGGTAGTFQASTVTSGSGAGVVNFNHTGTYTFAPNIAGTLAVNKLGAGTTILTGSNTHSGTTTISTGILQIGNGGTIGSISGNITNNASLIFNRSNAFIYGGGISGIGSLTKLGSGTTTLTGANTYTGPTAINVGKLLVNGVNSGTGAVSVASGAALGGTGTIAGAVTVANGGILSPGASPGTLSVGALTLNAASISEFELGTVSDLVAVADAFTLDGILNLSDSGGFTNTGYTLFTYGGALTNNYFEINTVPTGWNRANFVIDLNTTGEVNLLVDNTVTIQHWTGTNTSPNSTISGGSGTWNNVLTNWTNTNGSLNTEWQGVVGVFSGTAGTVNVADVVAFQEAQFVTDGYLLNGSGTIAVTGVSSEIWTGSGVAAEIATTISGTGALVKSGYGTLSLTGANSYAGGTQHNNGTLLVGDNNALGSGLLALGDATTFGVVSGGNVALANDVAVNGNINISTAGFGFLEFDGTVDLGAATRVLTFTEDGTDVCFMGAITGAGGLSLQAGPGVTMVAVEMCGPDNNTYVGLTTVGTGVQLALEKYDGVTAIAGDLTIDLNGGVTIFDTSEQIAPTSTVTVNGILGVWAVSGTTTQTIGNLQGTGAIMNVPLSAETAVIDVKEGDFAGSLLDNSGMGAGVLAVVKSGPGTLVLSGDNGYNGGTTITGGTLQTRSAMALGDAVVNTVNVALTAGSLAPVGTLTIDSLNWTGGTIASVLGTTASFVNITGNLALTGTGVFDFTDDSGFLANTTYAILGAANLTTFTAGNFAGNAVLGVTPTFTLVGNTLYVSFIGASSGPLIQNTGPVFTPVNADFQVNGAVQTGKSTESNIINSLTFADQSSVQVFNNLTVTSGNFNVATGSASMTGGNVIVPGAFNLNGLGTLIAASNFAIVGDANVNGGKLVIDGLFAAGGNANLSKGSELVINGSASIARDLNAIASGVTVNGLFAVGGSANLNQGSNLAVNAGGLMAVGEATNINFGSTAVINGQLASPQVNVNGGGLLKGAGLIAGNVWNNGTVAPGNSPGVLSIDGNYTQTSNGTLEIEPGDLLWVSGRASLAGTLQLVAAGKLKYGQQITFLQAGSISGDFDQILVPNPAKNRGRLLVDGGTGTLLIAPTSYTLVAETGNQRNVAKALDSFITARGDDREEVSIALDLQSAEQYPAAFDQIAPSFYESLADITIEQTNAQNQNLAQRASALRLGARGFQAIGIEAPLVHDKDGKSVMDAKDGKNILSYGPDNKWGVWVQGNGNFARITSASQVPNYRFESGGFLAGADYRWSENFVTGLYGGYQGTLAKYNEGGRTTINSVQFGGYASYDNGGFYADAIVGGGYSAYEVRRPINFSTIDRTARSRPDGGQFTTYLDFGYDWKLGNFTVGPIVSGQYTYAGIAPFTETGADSLDLSVGQQNANSLRTSLGGRIAYTWKVSEKFTLIPEGRMFWQHEFLENPRNIGASLDGGNGPSFGYTTSTPDRDAVFAGAGLIGQFGPNWNAYFYYNADFGRQDYISHSISTGLNFKF